MKIIRIIFVLVNLFAIGKETINAQSYCRLKINLLTENANVYIDNRQIKGSTLLNPIIITPGKHTISASLNNYIPFQETYNFVNGEFKIVSITLEKDLRSEITISSTSPYTVLSINSKIIDWDAASPYSSKIKPGNYIFEFTERTKISAVKDINIGENLRYDFQVDLKKDYPISYTTYDIGREVKMTVSVNDFLKPETETREVKSGEFLIGSIGMILGIVAGSKLSKGAESGIVAGLEIGGGAVLGYYIFKAFAPKKNKTFTIYENIEYNKGVPQMVDKMNRDVEIYNQETRRLIEEKEKEDYLKAAVKIRQQ